ncbi:uncharacterized protein LOC112343614 [Selaginella moellendorffii]|uniref:uncharacterized protein LOC112343614 n=1 Tax=Selaginella moellendorffii TaxID=88036 RepID=UPI000D1C9D65|nr:uncharacterized protein LOC112343614 [Selaginella moellendorffii]|eukprot:XP_024523146.1 uncharacterized protein LOC112343614 [Selaginella moellendorffii]
MDASQLPLESLLARDASKRKRVNRNAKLKQFKLDARREQWLSQGKLVASLSPNSVLESPSPKLGEEQHLHGSSTGGDSDAESCVINHDDLCDVRGAWCWILPT